MNDMEGDTDRHDRRELMRGAGMALLGRLGALIEAASFPLFLWLYGPVTFGLFATLWALVRIASGVTQMGMDVALPRFVPLYENDPDQQLRCVSIALLVSMAVGIAGGIALAALAPVIAPFIGGADSSADTILAIRTYAPVLPLWTLVEVLTAAIRSRRRFGPEIRIRFFYEQVLRVVFAVLLAVLGVSFLGLFIAQLLSAAISGLLAFNLLGKNFAINRLFKVKADWRLTREMLHYALPMMPSTLIQRFISELPVVILNIIIIGPAGAVAAGYYSIARKISSVMQIIHNSFDYVIAPLAAFRKGTEDMAHIADMYGYTARLMVAWGAILAAALIALSAPILAAIGPWSAQAANALVILVIGRYITFFFGQAPAIIRTLGSTWWTLANGVLGLLTMILLLVALVEDHGATGAAIAASAGLIVIRGLAIWEVKWVSGMNPYTREMWRPAIISLILGMVLVAAGELDQAISPVFHFPVLALVIVLSLLFLLRYGFSAEDAKALGRLGRFARKGRG